MQGNLAVLEAAQQPHQRPQAHEVDDTRGDDRRGVVGERLRLARGRLIGAAVQDVQVLYRQMPKVTGRNHFGARIAFAPDKTLFLTLGDRQRDDPAAPGPAWAQNAAVGQGKVLRLQRDGQPAAGTPAVAGGTPGLWSLGHRNPQGAAVHPASGELWLVEHGPQGGDELNRVRAGIQRAAGGLTG